MTITYIEAIGEAIAQRCFRPDHNQVRLHLLKQRNQRSSIHRNGVIGGDLCCPSVAGHTMNRGD